MASSFLRPTACPDTRRFNTPYEITHSNSLGLPKSLCLCRLNSIEPPWNGPVCSVVWEGWRRETSPYPDPWHEPVITIPCESVSF